MKPESNIRGPLRTRREFLGHSLAAAAGAAVLPARATTPGSTAVPLDIGSRLELFVDRTLLADMRGVELRLHAPVRQPLPKSPIKGHYMTVIRDAGRYRAYFRGTIPGYAGPTRDGHPGEITCYAESQDGHEWTLPNLGLFEIAGSRNNNVVLANHRPFSHNFSPFKDVRPGVADRERYKALAGTRGSGLHAFISADGINWEKVGAGPVIPFPEGRLKFGGFDSQNVSFWSEAEQCYVAYCRTKDTPLGNLRSISRATSHDFRHWSELVPTHPNVAGEHLYTSNTQPYFRAPHLYIALPTRFLIGRIGAESVKGNVGSTDVLFMAKRAGAHAYERLFTEAFIRPGLDPFGWANRVNYIAQNVVPTGPGEMSLYHNQGGYRYALRTDGFISVRAGSAAGELLTRPLLFTGRDLVVNYSTSAAGSLRVEVQEENGKPVPGLQLADCSALTGDEIERRITWKEPPRLAQWAGRPVRLRFVMKECDLYSFRFSET